MAQISKQEALDYHEKGRPGKIAVVPTKPHATAHDLSLAYSPGVAEPCLEIEKQPHDAYRYTNKGNLVAVISNGTAVLGLGNIGALAGKPVMEGKSLLFKIYGGVDSFDIEVDEHDPERFIQVVKAIAPTFGGINLEDIKAPECFEIETRLKAELDIPVMHDDQHGTAIISCAGLLNALQVVGKRIEDVRMVVNGAGAAAISCARLYLSFGLRRENLVMLDSRGVISTARTDINEQKREFATTRTDVHTLQEAMRGADVFVGLSKGNIVDAEMVRSRAERPIIFALANPVPEITYEEAKAARPDVLMSTGRTDYPNQINNVIGFPYIFRGALDVAATAINEPMKQAAVRAIAALAQQPVPEYVAQAYGLKELTFGADYFIPKPVDKRLIVEVSSAVARAAIESGVARRGLGRLPRPSRHPHRGVSPGSPPCAPSALHPPFSRERPAIVGEPLAFLYPYVAGSSLGARPRIRPLGTERPTTRRDSGTGRGVFAPQATSFPFSEKQPTQKNIVFLHVWVTAAPRPNVAAHLRTRHLRASHTESRRLPTDLE